jgi:hypothetical protein
MSLLQSNPTVLRPRARAMFLRTLAETCNVSKAARAAKVNRCTVYAWREADKEFREAWQAAIDVAAEMLEDVAVERATEGTTKPVFQNGVKVGEIREYSDSLLLQLLKAHKPAMYRERLDERALGGFALNIQINLGDEPVSSTPRVINESELLRALPPDYGSALALPRFAIDDDAEDAS